MRDRATDWEQERCGIARRKDRDRLLITVLYVSEIVWENLISGRFTGVG